VKKPYQMLHNSARDCGWSLMMNVVVLGLRRCRSGASAIAMLSWGWMAGGGADGDCAGMAKTSSRKWSSWRCGLPQASAKSVSRLEGREKVEGSRLAMSRSRRDWMSMQSTNEIGSEHREGYKVRHQLTASSLHECEDRRV